MKINKLTLTVRALDAVDYSFVLDDVQLPHERRFEKLIVRAEIYKHSSGDEVLLIKIDQETKKEYDTTILTIQLPIENFVV